MENMNDAESDQYIQQRYQEAIQYYWQASRNNKKWYKVTRSMTIILGALVTLTASLATAAPDSPIHSNFFTYGTPILAAMLTIISGFSQNFQWGSAWQNMVLTAQQLQKELDRYLLTPLKDKNFDEEAEKLNHFVISESEGFFERMLGGSKPNNNPPDSQGKTPPPTKK